MKESWIKQDSAAYRPYEKSLQYGAASLSDAELLATIIRSGVPGHSATEVAEQILRMHHGDGLLGLFHLTVQELMQINGIGAVKAVQLLSVAELSRRIASQRRRLEMVFSDPGSIADYYMERLRHEEKEQLYALFLDSKNRWVGETLLSKGTVNAAQFSVRELYQAALRARAVRLILIHNHPSGDPTPSGDDIRMTRQAEVAGRMLEVEVLDHIVIGDCCFCSLRGEGVFQSDCV